MTKYYFFIVVGVLLILSGLSACQSNHPGVISVKGMINESLKTVEINDLNDCDRADVRIEIPSSTSVHFTPDDSAVIVVNNNDISIIDITTNEKLLSFSNYIKPDSLENYHLISFGPDGNEVAYFDSYHGIVWNLKTGRPIQNLSLMNREIEGPIQIIDFPFGNKWLHFIGFIWQGKEDMPKTWIINTCELYPSVPSICPGAISPDGNKIAIYEPTTGISVIDVHSQDTIFLLEDSKTSSNYSFSLNGDYILSLDYSDWSIQIWNSNDGELITNINQNPMGTTDGPILGLQKFSFSNDGTRLVTFQPYARKVMIWETEKWELIHSIKVCEGIGDVALDSDGDSVAILSQNHISVFDISVD